MKIFAVRDEVEWTPPRPKMPMPEPLTTAPPPERRGPARPETTTSASPGHIYVDVHDVASQVVMRGDCHVEARTVSLLIADALVGQARWTGSSFGDLTWLLPVSTYQQQGARLVEEALVRAWSDPDVRRAASSTPAEAVLCGVRPETGAPDAGDLGRELGDLREHEALGIVRRAMRRFSWALRARRATPEEDAEGKDIVVETTDGELFVQVKNSISLVADWRKKHGERLGQRAFVMVWDRERPPSSNWVEAELDRAHRSILTPTAHPKPATTRSVSPLPSTERARLLAELPSGIRCLFDAAGKPLEGRGEAYLRNLVEAWRLALARDQEKTERVRISADGNAELRKTRDALRIVTRALQAASTAPAAALLATIATIDPRFVSDGFVHYEPASNAALPLRLVAVDTAGLFVDDTDDQPAARGDGIGPSTE